MRSKAKMKLSLVASCALSLLAVTSASISTFAWFSASADVEIEASTSSTTISVSAPDDITITPALYYYTGNGSTGYLPEADNATENAFTFSDFSNTNLASHLSLANLHPGYRMSFCVKCTSDDVPMGSLVLTVNEFASASHAGVSRYREDVTDTEHIEKITLARAIKIYTGYATSTSGSPTLSSNKFSWASATTKYEIFKQTSGIAAEAYIYYTVEFSNASATLYNEFSNSLPASYSNYVKETATTLDSAESSARYFRTAATTTNFGSGDSNCYIGLTFTLPKLVVSIDSI